MAIDVFNAAAPAAIATVSGYAISYFLYRITIAKWWGTLKSHSRSAKVKWLCGVLASFTTAQGLVGLIGEFLFVFFNQGSSLRPDKIIYYSQVVVGYIALFSVIGIILGIFVKDKNDSLDPSIKTSGLRTSASSPTTIKNYRIRNAALIAGIVTIALIASIKLGLIPLRKDEFQIASCNSCEFGKCSEQDGITGFKVLENGAQIYMMNKDGFRKIISLPADIDGMKCSVAKNLNNSFSCSEHNVSDGGYGATEISFNGADKFFWNHYASMLGKAYINSNLVCKIK